MAATIAYTEVSLRATVRRPAGARLIVSGIALALLLAVFSLGFETTIGPRTWSIICVVVAIAICLAATGSRKPDVFDPIYIIMAYSAFLFGARGIFVLEFDPYYFLPNATPDLLSTALSLAVIGFIAIYLGYCLGAGERVAEALPVPRLLVAGELRYPGIVILLATITGLVGLSLFAVARSAAIAPDVTAGAGLFWITGLMNLLPCALLFVILNGERRPLSIWRAVAVVALSACVLSSFLVFKSKLFVVETLIMALVLRHYRVRRLRVLMVLWIVIGSFVVMQSARVYIGLYSGHLPILLSTMFQSRDSLWMSLFSRFYGLDSMAAILIHTRGGNYEWGRSFAELAYWWIPRALWPNKPYSWTYHFSFLLAKYNRPSDAGMFSAPTFLGELYINFGVPGVIVGAMLFGIAANASYVYFVRRVPSKSGLLIYAIVLVHLGQLCESTLAVAIAMAMARIAPLLLLIIAARWVQGYEGEGFAPYSR